MLIEIVSNFNDLFRLCIDTKIKNNEANRNTDKGKKRKARDPPAAEKNKQPKSSEGDHSYAKDTPAGGSTDPAEDDIQQVEEDNEIHHVDE